MTNALCWDSTISFKKGKIESVLDVKCSAYPYGDAVRICFKTSKQIYYFELANAVFFSPDSFKDLCIDYFNTHRTSEFMSVGKCIRCSKWSVVSGVYCPRCIEANEHNVGFESQLTVLEEEF